PAIIAEIKKASPSKGIICKEFNHRSIAREYTDAGAAAISVLTDKVFFQGDISFISDIRTDVSIPILRKDFIIDSYQLAEAKAFGADAVLLIAAALGKNQLRELYDEAYATGLESLVEVHNEKELESLDLSRVKIVGINNRNLEDFSIDLDTSVRLAAMIPPGITIVSESGISMREDIEILLENGIQAVLVGEGLMRSANPGEALRAILTAGKNG
ncbi:MAG: indole-3-glycerol phosphate synthase TrpC, partial [Ignavibacteriaceae bacterium]|nr:indole-3-glycerol phosphate synthase TrpC [Ignavibacteriaceae bacterium]